MIERRCLAVGMAVLLAACSGNSGAPVTTAAITTTAVTTTADTTPITTPAETTVAETTLPLRPTDWTVCDPGGPQVTLLVQPALLYGIAPALDQFEADLCSEGYSVLETSTLFFSPTEIRDYLSSIYVGLGQRLDGVILIGDQPHAYQWIVMEFSNPDIPTLTEEVISFQFYSDLDGTFAASPGYASPGGFVDSFDIHEGELDWEIWVGVLPSYKGDLYLTMDALNRYFAKNHAYRAGEYTTPRAFLQIDELSIATTADDHDFFTAAHIDGDYAWTPFSDSPGAQIYFDSASAGLTVAQGYLALTENVADFTVADAHGWAGASGQANIAWVESNPVNTVFFWSNGCAVGNLDVADNFISAILYSPTSAVLVAKGTTNDSGGMGRTEAGFFAHNIATAMSYGSSLGDAVLAHVNDAPLMYPWDQDREFHYGTPILAGDPTLKLRAGG